MIDFINQSNRITKATYIIANIIIDIVNSIIVLQGSSIFSLIISDLNINNTDTNIFLILFIINC